MYGHCEECGAMYGTKDSINFAQPCEHMLAKLAEMNQQKELLLLYEVESTSQLEELQPLRGFVALRE